MSGYLKIFQVFEQILEAKFRPRYDTRLQLLAYQVKMLRSRIDDERIYTKPEEHAELVRLGALLDHDVSDVMLLVQPETYRGWLKSKEVKQRTPGRPRTAEDFTPLDFININMQTAMAPHGNSFQSVRQVWKCKEFECGISA